MHIIKNIHGREILDSRGNPTVEVEIKLQDGSFGRAAVPSGASTGSHEAVELRDNDKRYGGKGVQKAVGHINNEVAHALTDKTFLQTSLDETLISLDGTKNKARLGANTILGTSLAFAHAAAKQENLPLYQYFNKIAGLETTPSLPTPMINILNGGQHAESPKSADFQEFMIIPVGPKKFTEKLRAGAEVFHTLKTVLQDHGFNTFVGDEGGYAPALSSNKEALDLIIEAIKKAGYTPGADIALALDVAASEFYDNGIYHLVCENKKLTSGELLNLYEKLIDDYPIISIEDGFFEDDWDNFALMTQKLGNKIQVVGDDLFATNKERLAEGIKHRAANTILIKLNQIGTITETITTIKMAREANIKSIISHRSGETEDTSIADFAVGLGVGQIKTGSTAQSEHLAKYNQLLRIEEKLSI